MFGKTIIHTADWHLDATNRFDETVEVLEELIDQGSSRSPDLWVIPGDNYPVSVRASHPRERTELKRLLLKMASYAPVVDISGNHDCVPQDLDILRDEKAGIYIFTEPGIKVINGIAVGAIPFPSKGYLLKTLPDDVSKDDVDEACRVAMKGILNGMTVLFHDVASGFPRVLAAHLNVAGCTTGGFTLIGQDVEVGSQDLEDTGADYVALGHIHKMQNFGPRVWYSGSPRRVDFGEEGEEKGFLVATLERDQAPQVEFVPIAGKPMQTIRVTAGMDNLPTVIPGAEVRVIFELTETQRAQLDANDVMKRIQADQAHSIKTEYRIESESRVRSEAIQSAKTDRDRLLAYFAQLDPPVPEAEAIRLTDLAADLDMNSASGGNEHAA